MKSFSALPHFLTRHWLGALLFVTAFVAGLSPCADGDVWWHLAAGREMVARRALLFADPFSVSALGRAWTDVHWLFQLSVYAVHRLGGLAGLVLFKCALVALGAVLLLSIVQRQRLAPWAAPVLASWLGIALFLARSLLLVRPVIVTLVCLALFLRELEQLRLDGRTRRVVFLLLVQLVWANCQGLSALGPAVVGAYLVGEFAARRPWRTLALAELGCIAASLCTPFGSRGLSLSGALLARLLPSDGNVYAKTIAENVPPFLLERVTGGELWHLKWYCVCLGLALLAGGRRIQLRHTLLLVGFGALALLANRNVLLFYWVSSPLAALYLAPAVRRSARWLGRERARFLPLLNAVAIALILAVSSVASARETPLAAPSPFRAPSESAARLAAMPPGDVFCADQDGGYLIWRLFPQKRPYIDTRLVLRTADEYAEYLALADFPERFEAFQARHHFGYVLLPVAFPDRYLGLIRELYGSKQFRLVFTNGSEVLFARRDLDVGPTFDLGDENRVAELQRDLERRFGRDPKVLEAARLQLATLELAVEEPERAQQALKQVTTPAAATLMARVRYLQGDLGEARAAALDRVRAEPDDVASLTLLSHIALEQGQNSLGMRYARRALAQNPFDFEATQLLNSLEAREP